MPESKTNDFVWDGSQKNFAIFEDKVFERFLGGNGGRIQMLPLQSTIWKSLVIPSGICNA